RPRRRPGRPRRGRRGAGPGGGWGSWGPPARPSRNARATPAQPAPIAGPARTARAATGARRCVAERDRPSLRTCVAFAALRASPRGGGAPVPVEGPVMPSFVVYELASQGAEQPYAFVPEAHDASDALARL